MNEQSSQPSPIAELPPLRIHHFLIWMVAAAIVLSFYSAMTRAVKTDSLLPIVISIRLVLMSVATATLALGLSWRMRDKPFFNEVGQWLLLCTTLELFTHLLPGMMFCGSLTSGNWWRFIVLATLLSPLLSGAALLYASRTAADTAAWKRFCIHMGVMCLLGALWVAIGVVKSLLPTSIVVVRGDYSRVMQALTYFVIPIYWGILCALAVREDFVLRRSRHWTHWCGIITWLATAIAMMLFLGYAYSTV